jgi:purine-binding chemotaxis protein CheW
MTLYSTFFVDERYLGVPVERVQEVLRAQPVTPVPLAHPHIAGLLNLRGRIVTALDMRARLDVAHDAAGAVAGGATIIVTGPDGPLALQVDALGDVVAVDDERFEPPPDTLDADRRRLIKGAFKLADALLLDLNLDETLQLTT